MSFSKRLFWLLLWGIAFGFVESSVVVYLRAIYYPEGFHFPLVPMDTKLALNEVVREAATLVMLWINAVLSYSTARNRIAAFLILFATWDIFYYVFLKVVLDWPQSLLTWDILFLIPIPWAGPVIAPVTVAVAMLLYGIWLLYEDSKGVKVRFSKGFYWGVGIGCILILASFLIPGWEVLKEGTTTKFPWTIYGAGYVLALFSMVRFVEIQRSENR